MNPRSPVPYQLRWYHDRVLRRSYLVIIGYNVPLEYWSDQRQAKPVCAGRPAFAA
jgi:hypothetical protein